MEYRAAAWVSLHGEEMRFVDGEDLNEGGGVPAIVERLECRIDNGAIHIRTVVDGSVSDEWVHCGGFTLKWSAVG